MAGAILLLQTQYHSCQHLCRNCPLMTGYISHSSATLLVFVSCFCLLQCLSSICFFRFSIHCFVACSSLKCNCGNVFLIFVCVLPPALYKVSCTNVLVFKQYLKFCRVAFKVILITHCYQQ